MARDLKRSSHIGSFTHAVSTETTRLSNVVSNLLMPIAWFYNGWVELLLDQAISNTYPGFETTLLSHDKQP